MRGSLGHAGHGARGAVGAGDPVMQLIGKPVGQLIGALIGQKRNAPHRCRETLRPTRSGLIAPPVGSLCRTGRAVPVRAVARGHEHGHGLSSQKTG